MVFICFTNHTTVVEPKFAKFSISHGKINFVVGPLYFPRKYTLHILYTRFLSLLSYSFQT